MRLKNSSLGKIKNKLRKCKGCNFSTITQDIDICPVCSNKLDRIEACSPLGFCVDYEKNPRDFNGVYDWHSPVSDIALDCSDRLESIKEQIKNIHIRTNVIPSTGRVHLVNDNNGYLFTLGRKEDGSEWFCRDTISDDKERKKLSLLFEKKYAFVSTKTTGVMALSIGSVSDNLCLKPIDNTNAHAVKAAFLSWGYLVRRSIANFLDIDAQELSVGYNIEAKTSSPEAFFVEKLDNGAGYCNYLTNGNIINDAIINPLINNGQEYNKLTNEDHSKCSASCYDCIRDYGNQNIHNIIDWRLGLDLARLSDDPNADIGFCVDYWIKYIDNIIINMIKKQGFTVNKISDNIITFSNEQFVYLLTHPLWSESYIDNIKFELGMEIDVKSIYDLLKI